MKKKIYENKTVKRRTVCIVLSLAMAAGLAGCGKEEAQQAQIISHNNQEEVLKEVLNAQVNPSHSSMAGKEETVYVLADAKGGVNQVIVSDWLKNGDGSNLITDKTSLKDIRNVKGYGDFETDENGNLVWQTEGNDVYYQGTADKEVPVEVKLSYQLNGKAIEPEALAGKSGKVTIRMDYENKETRKVSVGGKEEEIKVPFAMISGMILPQDTFSNIEVKNGRLLSEGNNSVVVGVAFPGLKESIDLDNLKEKASDRADNKELDGLEIPDYIEVTADTECFALGMTMTVAMSDVLSDISLTDSIDLSDLNNSMDELADASGRLKEGSSELKNGTGELREGTGRLKDGASELLDGTNELADGTAALKDGVQELFEKSGDLDEGAGKLNEGAAALYNGTEELAGGVSELKSGAGQLKDGSQRLAEGTGSLVTGAESLNSGAVQIENGVTQVAGTLKTLSAAIGTTSDASTLLGASHALNLSLQQILGADKYGDILAALSVQRDEAQANLAAAGEELSAARSCSQQAQAELSAACQADTQEMTVVTGAYTETEERSVSVEAPVYYTTVTVSEAGGGDFGADMDEASEEDASGGTVTSESTSEYSQTIETTVLVERDVVETDTVEVASIDVENLQEKINAYQQSLENVAVCEAQVTAYTLQAKAIDEQIAEVQAQAAAEAAATEQAWGVAVKAGVGIETGLTEIADRLNSPQNAALMAALVKGAGDLADGTQSALSGARELDSGANELRRGIDTLNDGAGALAEGTGSLKDGAAELRNGTLELKNGTVKLVEGTGTLNDGAASLNDGVSTLKSGVVTLKDGVLTLDEGAGTLDEGALTLMDGMFEFDEEGIGRLTELFGDDVQDVTDRLKAVADAGKEYSTFTELPEGMDGSVKFVIRTEGIK
ncbi:MAG: hypothetical protein K2P30_06375 [Lachnospiraceae bacterium]|nr:hypothetical protein [Lachnospiraceae bacterium]